MVKQKFCLLYIDYLYSGKMILEVVEEVNVRRIKRLYVI